MPWIPPWCFFLYCLDCPGTSFSRAVTLEQLTKKVLFYFQKLSSVPVTQIAATLLGLMLPILRSSLHRTGLRRSLATGSSADLEAATKTWQKGLKLAEQNDPAALCDVGWGYHQGTNPLNTKSIDTAIDYYMKSATLGYSPAASLLADIHYYDTEDRKDWEVARKYLDECVALTSDDEPGDAYLRAKSLQKLGMIECRGGGGDDGMDEQQEQHHAGEKNRDKGMELFRDSLELCEKHLGGGWAFLLSHDPPGLFDQLENEQKLLGNDEVLGRVMCDLVNVDQETAKTTGEGGESDTQAASSSNVAQSQLLYYTRNLRAMETSKDFVLKMQEDMLDTFPNGSEGGAWGITYFASSLRVFMEPVVQNAVSRGWNGGVPKVVVLGSALGNAVAWPSMAFGFRGVGLDVLSSCTEAATELYEEAVEAIAKKNEMLTKYGQDSSGSSAGDVRFDTIDVVENDAVVRKECMDANVVWLNDYSWSVKEQREVERTTMESLPSGSVLVLYRPPHHAPANPNAVTKVLVATSWNPTLEMCIVLKE